MTSAIDQVNVRRLLTHVQKVLTEVGNKPITFATSREEVDHEVASMKRIYDELRAMNPLLPVSTFAPDYENRKVIVTYQITTPAEHIVVDFLKDQTNA